MSDNRNDAPTGTGDAWGPDPASSIAPKPDEPLETPTSSVAGVEPDPCGPAKMFPVEASQQHVRDRSQWTTDGKVHDEQQLDDAAAAWKHLFLAATGPIAIAMLAITGGVLGLYLTAQVTALYATIASLPVLEAWLAVSALSLCAVAVVGGFGYFLLGYLRMRKNRQVHLRQLQVLDDRADLRKASAREAMELLRAYLETFPLDQRQTGTKLWDESEQRKLVEAREKLLGVWWQRRAQSPDDWLKRFVDEFQTTLDAAASRKTNQIASLAAFKTAVSPNPLVDTAIMLFWSFKMLGDLCRVYNLRVGAIGTMFLLTRVFFSAYIAGRLDEFEEHAEESLDNVLDQLPVADMAKTIVGKVAVRAGAGLANYFLIKRLGNRAIRMLRPVDA